MAELAEQLAVLEMERSAREDDQQQRRVRVEAATSRSAMTMKDRRRLAHRNNDPNNGYRRPSETAQFQLPDKPPTASLSAVAGAGFGGLADISFESTETGSGSTTRSPRRKPAVEYSEDDRDW